MDEIFDAELANRTMEEMKAKWAQDAIDEAREDEREEDLRNEEW